jgi:thiol-disulfide isomerase/thioredoxin
MKRFFFLALSLALMTVSSEAQFVSGIKPLTIGDTLPDVLLHDVYRYKADSIRTKDLRGKVVVLDFFATHCGPCLALLPHLDTLQGYFGNQVQFLVVDQEPYPKITAMLPRLKWMPPLKHLSFVTKDTLLSELFPYRTIPHEVIIDANGRIQAITYAYNVTKPVIQSVIDGHTLHLTVKKEQMDYSIKKPLFYYGNGGDISQVYLQSTFCHYIEGLPAGMNTLSKRYDAVLNDSLHERILAMNASIPFLYRAAAYPRGRWKYDRMVLEVQDSSRYINLHHEHYDQWATKNTYCYELIAPAHMPRATLRRYMLEDLNRSLGINGRFEKRVEDCWLLVRTTQSDSLYKAHGNIPGEAHKAATFSGATMGQLTAALNTTNAFVFDETHYTGKVDINLNVNLQDLPDVRKALHAYGLDLVPTRRMMTMLVLTEKNYNNQLSKMADTTGSNLRPRFYIK